MHTAREIRLKRVSEKSQTFRYSLIGFPLFVGKAVVIVSGALAIPLKTKLAIICNMNQHDPDGPNDFFFKFCFDRFSHKVSFISFVQCKFHLTFYFYFCVHRIYERQSVVLSVELHRLDYIPMNMHVILLIEKVFCFSCHLFCVALCFGLWHYLYVVAQKCICYVKEHCVFCCWLRWKK